MEKTTQLWQKIIHSRALAGVGIAVLLLAGGFGITRVASAQSANYLIPASTLSLMQQQIQNLTDRVTSLENEVRLLQNGRPVIQPVANNPVIPTNPSYIYTYPGPASTQAPSAVVIDQNGGSYVAGFDIYITGRGFLPNEQLLVTRNGIVVGHTTVDAGGNFSTSGIMLPLGTSMFTFTGQTSGISAVATVNGVANVPQ